ncbi:hypothetical protein EJ02DRAFT_452973 [Clathrospora elynae]|uniref:Transcriptional activator HAP2 n=1 Tax=Clathrospora elynae TaxID=706981 RepID=A0A6A5SVG4_9PLEO|nr:hypothetical protein EJ02DRAFT_452973 [Clathrospora elynae]
MSQIDNMTTSNEQPPDTPPHLNVKQITRIQKRRIARQQLHKTLALSRQLFHQSPPHPYLRHACSRGPRGPDGQFLTPEQIATQNMEKLGIEEAAVKSTDLLPLTTTTEEKPKL